jgi:hypothetical protein
MSPGKCSVSLNQGRTEHRTHDCMCVVCGSRTRAAFPEGVTAPMQHGQRVSAFVLYLLHYQLLSMPAWIRVDLARDICRPEVTSGSRVLKLIVQ